MQLSLKIDKDLQNKKLVDILRNEMEISTRLMRQLKKDKRVTVNGHKLSFNALLRNNDLIVVELPDEKNLFEPEDLGVEVLYEDEHLMIINKAPYYVVHPTKGHPYNTVANGIAFIMLARGEHYKIRFANRLDRDTSGAMIICKTGMAQKIVSDQMQAGTILKQYTALVEGLVVHDKGTINEPIGRASEDSVHRIVRSDGAASVTHYEVLERFKEHTLLLITLETGRTHQIRVHLKHLGHVLVGDVLYGGDHTLIERQALHSTHLVLKALSHKTLRVTAPLLEDMNILIEKLRQK